jgi:TRAP transporter TAXI family solute receptor
MAAGGCERRSDVAFVRLASGPAGGAWYPLGAKIAQVLGSEIPEISTSNLPGGGETNVMDVHRGVAEMAFTYSSAAYDGYRGIGQFPGPQTNVRHFATLYPAALQTAVRRRSEINSYADLTGRNISPGKAGWSGTVIVEEVLAAYGITFAAVREAGGAVHHVDYADSGALMKDGHIEAFTAVAGVPLSSMTDINFQPGIRFLSVEPDKMQQILASNPTLIETVIPATAYEGLTQPVPTIGVATVMIVHKDMPEDLVYQMAKLFWESHAQFEEVSPVWRDVHRENALQAGRIPRPLRPCAPRAACRARAAWCSSIAFLHSAET